MANVPIVMGIELPKTLYEIDPKKVFALTINPVMLQTIRRERAKSLGFVEDERSSYAEMVHVREELDYASWIFAQNPTWPVIGEYAPTFFRTLIDGKILFTLLIDSVEN